MGATADSASAESKLTGEILLVPIPSSSRANRKRGYRHSYLLVRELAKELSRATALKVVASELLQTNRKIADQSALNRQERLVNMHGAYSLVAGASRQRFQGNRLYLVDDLVTSGSSLREGLRALRSGGFSPTGVLLAGVST